MAIALLWNACSLTQRPDCANSGHMEASSRFLGRNASCQLSVREVGEGGTSLSCIAYASKRNRCVQLNRNAAGHTTRTTLSSTACNVCPGIRHFYLAGTTTLESKASKRAKENARTSVRSTVWIISCGKFPKVITCCGRYPISHLPPPKATSHHFPTPHPPMRGDMLCAK